MNCHEPSIYLRNLKNKEMYTHNAPRAAVQKPPKRWAGRLIVGPGESIDVRDIHSTSERSKWIYHQVSGFTMVYPIIS